MAPSSKKLLSYPIYYVGTNPNVHVQVFWKTIQANGEKQDVDIMNLFFFTLRDSILEWGKKIMQSHLGCIFLKLKTTFYKCYYTIQNDEHVYMALKVI
jgi:hypothetical protein